MSANKRRIAVLGSRSVGMLSVEFRTIRVLMDPPFPPITLHLLASAYALLQTGIKPYREVLAHNPILPERIRRVLLPDHRIYVCQDNRL
jgi:hypothetical protein